MFLNHRGLHYYSYLGLEIIKNWGESKGTEEGGSRQSTWNLSAAQGSITRVVGDMDKCGCFQADDGVEGLIHSPSQKDAGWGALGSERRGGSVSPSASSSSCLSDVVRTILSSGSFLWYISPIRMPFSPWMGQCFPSGSSSDFQHYEVGDPLKTRPAES